MTMMRTRRQRLVSNDSKARSLRVKESSRAKEVQELRATLEDRDSRLEDMRVMLENCNDEVMEERVTHTREERDRLQLRHNEACRALVTTQQELAEARSEVTRAQEVEALKDRQLATFREEQLQKDREIEARQLNSSKATAREAHSRFQVQMEVQRQFMLPPATTPAYFSNSKHNQLAFQPLTPASGMSTQELRVPTTYLVGPLADQRGTPSGTNAMNAMCASSEDRHHRDRVSSDGTRLRRHSGSDDRYHRGRSRSDDRHPRQRGESEDRHRRRSRSGDSYHRDYDHSDDRHRHESGSMSSSLFSSQPAWQS